jgi:hypothetical protein
MLQRSTIVRTIFGAGIVILFGAVLLVVLSDSSLDDTISDLKASSNENLPEWHRNITKIRLPEHVTLFGSEIPLSVWEVRERFEREFYYNYSNPDQLLLWTKRLRRWERYVDSNLSAAGLHPDYKYLMIAESGVRNVQSPAKAHGFWQFIPPTAERYGLRVDNQIDERLDPIRATSAAVAYLSKLRRQFNDDYLASAAYNMGEYGLESAMDYQKERIYWNLYLPEETMRYLLRIAVIKELMTNGEKYGFNFDNHGSYEPLAGQTIRVRGPIDNISDWARSKGVTYKDVKIFNPWIVGKGLPAGSFEIVLPETLRDRTTVATGE